jgi:hypothetical protein
LPTAGESPAMYTIHGMSQMLDVHGTRLLMKNAHKTNAT